MDEIGEALADIMVRLETLEGMHSPSSSSRGQPTLEERIEQIEQMLKEEPMHKSLKTLVMELKDKVEQQQGQLNYEMSKWNDHLDVHKKEKKKRTFNPFA